MKTLASFLALTIATAVLSACGGSPMTVESRTASDSPQELSFEDKMKIRRQHVRARDQ